MNQPDENVQEVITIRYLLETLWKGKVLIAIVTAVAVFASAIASFFIITEEYAANASLAVSPFTIKVSVLDNSVSIVDYLATISVLTKATYVQQVKSSKVLEDTIEKLDMKDASGNFISADSLSSAVAVTDVANSNLIQITVSGTDPEKTKLIANTICQSFIEFVTENTKEQIQTVADSISVQLSNEEKNLHEKKQILEEYLSGNENVDVLKGKTTSLINLIVSYNNDLQNLETQIDSDTKALQSLGSTSQSTESIGNEDYIFNIGMNGTTGDAGQTQVSTSPGNLENSLRIVDINSIQTRLIRNKSQKESLEKRLPELESSLIETQTLLANEEYKYNVINGDMVVAQLNYQAYAQRNREVTTYTQSDIGKTIISLSSEALQAQKVSPNEKKNIVIAGALGFCLSILFVLFRNYWKKTKVSQSK